MSDIRATTDIDPFLGLVDDRRATAQRVLCSIAHPPGTLWWAPERGYALTNTLHVAFQAGRVQAAVQNQAELDERVDSASVTATAVGGQLDLQIELELNDGTDATLEVSISELGEVLNASVT